MGRLEGLRSLCTANTGECFEIAYADGKVLVPAASAHLLMWYGPAGSATRLDRLKADDWLRRRDRSNRRIGMLARRLVGLAARRKLSTAPRLKPPAGAYHRFVQRFPFEPTPDQKASFAAVLKDLASGRAMDRLVCGDVGSGKTEVALRAAFVASINRFQVAVLVPTTILAGQHLKTFKERFEGFPVRVELASRTASQRERQRLQQKAATGAVDVVIGTHALLSKELRFTRLGLIVVDEEHRFGVQQKERLKQLREGVHVLTLTATPIPRTLQLAMTSVREPSLILTPPRGRRPVETIIVEEDSATLVEALRREKARKGLSFYICPRIADLDPVSTRLSGRAPELSVACAHVKLPTAELDEIIREFAAGRYDVLLSTTIVESGLDVPRANTMIIHRCDRLGLAQLYQLRGRVGRSSRRAQCLLCLPPRETPTKTARNRLQVLTELDTVGAGFALAERDMDLRGAGNLLGEEQSGFIKDVGLELFQLLLGRAIRAIQMGRPFPSPWAPVLHLGIPAFIPETYVADEMKRLELYKRITGEIPIARVQQELHRKYGVPPPPVQNLLTGQAQAALRAGWD